MSCTWHLGHLVPSWKGPKICIKKKAQRELVYLPPWGLLLLRNPSESVLPPYILFIQGQAIDLRPPDKVIKCCFLSAMDSRESITLFLVN